MPRIRDESCLPRIRLVCDCCGFLRIAGWPVPWLESAQGRRPARLAGVDPCWVRRRKSSGWVIGRMGLGIDRDVDRGPVAYAR